MSLRGKLVRLAHTNPELRPHLLSIIAKAEKVQVLNENGRKVWVSPETLKPPKGKK